MGDQQTLNQHQAGIRDRADVAVELQPANGSFSLKAQDSIVGWQDQATKDARKLANGQQSSVEIILDKVVAEPPQTTITQGNLLHTVKQGASIGAVTEQASAKAEEQVLAQVPLLTEAPVRDHIVEVARADASLAARSVSASESEQELAREKENSRHNGAEPDAGKSTRARDGAGPLATRAPQDSGELMSGLRAGADAESGRSFARIERGGLMSYAAEQSPYEVPTGRLLKCLERSKNFKWVNNGNNNDDEGTSFAA